MIDDDKDEKTYDLVVVGTGLVESLIACSAAQAGKKVLHIDALDLYGRNEQTQTLEEFIKEGPSADRGALENKGAGGDFLKPRVIKDASSIRRKLEASVPSVTAVPTVQSWHPRKDHPAFCGHFEKLSGVDYRQEEGASIPAPSPSSSSSPSSSVHPSFQGYRMSTPGSMGRLLLDSRKFALDLSPKLILASGDMVDCLLRSGTANYMEFKAMDGLYFVSGDESKPSVQRVPCSKSDVFANASFTALEKRKLMKFLQAAMDWGRQDKDGADLNFLNETQLAQGRSLHRPQNKAAAGTGTEASSSSFKVDAFADRPIQEFLADAKLPERLQKVVVHALCLHVGPTSGEGSPNTIDAVRTLYRHLLALGRFGNTAFIYPLYGSAELTQAFCRMCAVWGGAYMLRTAVEGLEIDSTVGLVTALHINSSEDNVGKITVKAGAVVMSTHDWGGPLTATTSLVTRTSVCRGAPLDNSERSFGVLPPETCGNDHCIHIFQLDSGAAVCPDDYTLVYLITTVPSEMGDVEAAGILHAAARLLQSAQPFEELFSSVSRRAQFTAPPIESLPPNVAVVAEQGQEPYIDGALLQARGIFSRLFPGSAFLDPPKTDHEDNDEEEFLEGFDEPTELNELAEDPAEASNEAN